VELRSLARGKVRRRSVGLERERRVYARQVLDAGSALRARLIEDGGNITRKRGCFGLTMDIEGSLVARLQILSRPSPSCPSQLVAWELERRG
jgi:hypothetical protein